MSEIKCNRILWVRK